MQMPTHSDYSKQYFRSLALTIPSVEVRPMFGSVAASVNGNMFAGLFGDNIGVKLGLTDTAELDALPGSGPFGPEQRPMGGYRSLPQALPDPEKIAWMIRARDYVASLPPKIRKTRST